MSFASSVTFDLSLEDLIQGLGDTSWVLVEGWEGGTSGRVKSQLPSLGLGHVWGTTHIPSSLWKQVVASLSTTCMISDPDWFHHLTCPASPETSLVSLGEFFFFYFWQHCWDLTWAMTGSTGHTRPKPQVLVSMSDNSRKPHQIKTWVMIPWNHTLGKSPMAPNLSQSR